MKMEKTKKEHIRINILIAIIIACMMIIGLPVLCEADDEKGDEHVGSASVKILNISSIRM